MSRSTPRMFQLDLDSAYVEAEQWYLVVLRSKDQESELMLFDQSFQKIDGTEEGPLFLGQNSDFDPFYERRRGQEEIEIYLGMNSNERSAGIEGSIRQVQLLGTYLNSIQKIKNAAFTQLLKEVEPSLFFQTTLFNTTVGLLDSASQVQGSIISSTKMSGGVTPKIDLKSQFFCWVQAEEQYIEYFTFDSRSAFEV